MSAATATKTLPQGTAVGARRTLPRAQWIILGMLAVVEIVSAIYLARLNPVQGYDENWYLINSYRIRGVTTLPYAHHRPPMFPILLAVFGDHARLVSGVAHIASTALVFILLRRLVSPAFALAGVVVFMACGQLRMYNVFLLTEMLSVALLLLAVHCFVASRPFLLGVVGVLLVMTHWSMATVPPVVLGVYAWRRRRQACGWFIAGSLFAAAPFLIGFHRAYGNPLAPVLANLGVQRIGANDRWYYLRELLRLPLPLLAGCAATLCYLIGNRVKSGSRPWYDLCVLVVGMIAARAALLHLVVPKGLRFVVPMLPLFLILSALMVRHYGLRRPRVQWALWVILLVSVLPDKQLFYYVHDLANDPVNQITELQDSIAKLDPTEPIYTDLNDLAVMGHTGHPAVAVIGPGTWHHVLLDRNACTREDIPDGAAYITWNPATLEVLGSSATTRHGTLSLVRWRTEAHAPGADPAISSRFSSR